MVVLIDHAPVNQPTGSQDYGPVNVPNNTKIYTLRLARHTTATPQFWPNVATVVDIKLLLSLDGGQTFPIVVLGFITNGDTKVIMGKELPENAFVINYASAFGIGAKAKAAVVVTNGALVSQLTVEAA